MLSKSAARAFFLTGTALCSLLFFGLTADTLRRIPAQTKSAELNDAAKRGKHLWESSNCMGCHTLLGEGAYYAPELTRVYQRRGEAFIRAMLRDPEGMYPGERKMQNYHFNDAQIDDLVAFLKWIGNMDLNGFPPKPHLGLQAVAAGGGPVAELENRPQVFNQLCLACHQLGGQGGTVGPALDGVGTRRDRAYITKWLEDPLSMKQDSKMPKLPLTQSQVSELAAFLSQLKKEPVK